eukprot:TRINITY_DN11539_c7_g1_i1.p1 TRINITY_DN11539_c7_g1~~TRINITY_DN11539_c7_g1_i1.p1  ORF type:complete len:406 (+),score=73.03 TRINITY_DN11539_c7_g1_i1:86-1303(+)
MQHIGVMNCALLGLLAILVLEPCAVQAVKRHGSAVTAEIQNELITALSQTPLMHSTANLIGIEASLMSMAKAGATPGLRPFVDQIKGLTGTMKTKVEEQSKRSQASLDASWDWFKGCSRTTGFNNNNVAASNRSFMECSAAESSAYREWKQCLTGCNEVCTNPVKCVDDPYPDPGHCQMKDPSVWDGTRDWMKQLRDSYKRKYDEWKEKQDRCKQVDSICKDCYKKCWEQNKKYKMYEDECNQKQKALETAACNTEGNSCQAYKMCYESRKHAWQRTNRSVAAEESNFFAEYRGILRVECFVQAFVQNLDDPKKELQPLIEACRKEGGTRYSNMGTMVIKYKKIEDNPLEECTSTGSGTSQNGISKLTPGTPEWVRTYYSNLPPDTYYEACDACCCADLPNGPTC